MIRDSNEFTELASDDDFRVWLPKALGQEEADDKPLSLYLMVDTARCTTDEENRRLDDICQGSVWTGLYDDFEGDEWKRLGPRLIRVADVPELIGGTSLGLPRQAVSYLLARDSLPSLNAHLLKLREIVLPDGGRSLFRFQDAIVLRELGGLLNARQIAIMLGDASSWAVPCACGGFGVFARNTDPVSGELVLAKAQFEALNERLLPYSIKAEVDEVDSAILLGKDPCQVITDLRSRIEVARSHGIDLDDDVSLFCVLGLQLPAGFEDVKPFSRILQSVRRDGRRFSVEVGKVTAEEWESFEGAVGFDVNA
ncbi:DUF4123 domain-containing protein [Jeongeupia chitinilytica]|uniref:DUF4123 domain-containing protein n=1 Tax=Jeongeupia chitinilytica TaxID=1041641 RepID=A0ABQ3H6R3_9NEIS|nr:DUF4123 domain-containing protein [Jeongeupia chitinilytica]GHD69863.1 hypothetical protein GCM10007350_37160 [Jeongeupia chitinilytica]